MGGYFPYVFGPENGIHINRRGFMPSVGSNPTLTDKDIVYKLYFKRRRPVKSVSVPPYPSEEARYLLSLKV